MKRRKKMKRIVCILISCVLFTTIWIQGPCAYANTASGECGQEASSIVWYFDTSTGTLEIEGQGTMADYSNLGHRAPWYDYSNLIHSVIIKEGITHLSQLGFYNCVNLQEIQFPNSLKTIGESCFRQCERLESLSFPNSLERIKAYAFMDCNALKTVTIPCSTTIEESAFTTTCNSIKNVTITAGTGIMPTTTSLVQPWVYANTITLCDGIQNLPPNFLTGFSQCSSLVLPKSLNLIDQNALVNCNLQTITILNPNCTILATTLCTKSISGFNNSTAKDFALQNDIIFNTLTNCNDYGIVHVPAPKENENYVEETCTTDGSYTEIIRCKHCNSVLQSTDVILPSHHIIESRKENEIASTCSKAGSYDLVTYCSRCNIVLQTKHISNDALPHNYGEWKIVTSPSCTSTGISVRSCNECGVIERKLTPALGHKEICDESPTEPTCTNPGNTKQSHCEYCKAVLSEKQIIPATGHNWDNGKTITSPTCNHTGKKQLTCLTCGVQKVVSIAQLPHSPVTDPAVQPTCTKSGKSAGRHCKICGTIIQKQSTLKALGHQPQKIKGVNATYWKNGKTDGTKCKKCKIILTKQTKIEKKSVNCKKIKGLKKGFDIQWIRVKDSSGYQIRYSRNKSMKSTKTLSIKGGNSTHKQILKLKKHTKYYVQIRAYKTVNGKRLYSNWSKTKSVTTK